MNELLQYVIALTNFYGIISKKQVVDIYNMHHAEPIALDDVHALYKNPPPELTASYIAKKDGFFVLEVILEADDFDQMLQDKGERPYYIPSRAELLQYLENGYIERTMQYDALSSYLQKHWFPQAPDLAESFILDVRSLCEAGMHLDDLAELIQEWGFGGTPQKNMEELLKRMFEFGMETRLWVLNGHTVKEVIEKYELPGLLNSSPEQITAKAKVIDIQTRRK